MRGSSTRAPMGTSASSPSAASCITRRRRLWGWRRLMYGASVLTMERAPFAISQFDDPVVEGDEPLSPLQVLFSLRGRIPRKTWWAYGVLGLTWFGLHAYMLLAIVGFRAANAEQLVNLLVFWPALALLVKRWHDRDRT